MPIFTYGFLVLYLGLNPSMLIMGLCSFYVCLGPLNTEINTHYLYTCFVCNCCFSCLLLVLQVCGGVLASCLLCFVVALLAQSPSDSAGLSSPRTACAAVRAHAGVTSWYG